MPYLRTILLAILLLFSTPTPLERKTKASIARSYRSIQITIAS